MERNLLAIDIGSELWLKENQGITGTPAYRTVGGILSIILRNVFVVAGILLFLLLLIGGFSIIMGAGSGDSKKTAQGQQAVTSALVGFLLIFGGYWIIQIIQLVTGLNILNSTF